MPPMSIATREANAATAGPARRRVIVAILLILAAGVCAFDMHRFLGEMESGMPTLKRWLPYAAELGADGALYSRHPDYLYPPVFLVLLRPLTWVPPSVAAVLWQLAKYVSVMGIFVMAWRALAPPSGMPVWVKVCSILMSLRFIHSDPSHGNVNIFIAFLVVSAWFLLVRGRDFSAGLLVALAVIKVTRLIWAAYLLYVRRWRAAAGVAVGLFLAIEVVPLVVVSPKTNHALVVDWYRHVAHGYLSKGEVYSTRINQSMAAVMNRLLGRSDLAPDEPSVAVADLAPSAITWLQRAAAAAIFAALAWFCRPSPPPRAALPLAVDWSLVAAASLLLSGYTWSSHLCLLALPHVVVLAYLAGERPRVDRPVLVFVSLSFAFCSLTGDNLTSAGREWASAVGSMCFGALFLFAALTMIRSRLRAPSAATC